METFVIQIRPRPQQTTQERGDELRGLAEHIGSGRRERFTNAGEPLAFLHADHRDPPKEAER